VNGGHFRVHAQRRVGEVATASHGLIGRERRRSCGIFLLSLRLITLLLELLLHCKHSGAIECSSRDAPSLESSSIKPGTVVVIALANDLAATDNNAAVAVVHGRLGGLLKAKSKVIVRLHCDCLTKCGGLWLKLAVKKDY